MKLRILVIDDDPSMCELIRASLGGGEWQVVTSSGGDEGLELASQHSFDVVIMDMNLRSFNGLDVCRALTENRPDLPVILITAFGTMELAIASMRARAHDFINKPVDMSELRAVIELALRGRHRREQIRPLAEATLAGDGPVGRLLGQSKGMLEVYRLIRRVATTDTAVLLSGESGTGKELVASALHGDRARAQAPFVALNCAAVPCSLLESELFGHLQGSFTDATSNRQGLFQQAGAGTLFLDEIGEMPLQYHWPGNVRQLENSMERAVALTSRNEITVEDLPDRVQRHGPASRLEHNQELGGMATLGQRERWHVERVLASVGGNKTEAAKLLGVNRRTLYRKLEQYEGTPATQGRVE